MVGHKHRSLPCGFYSLKPFAFEKKDLKPGEVYQEELFEKIFGEVRRRKNL
jgi:hypothetical protein